MVKKVLVVVITTNIQEEKDVQTGQAIANSGISIVDGSSSVRPSDDKAEDVDMVEEADDDGMYVIEIVQHQSGEDGVNLLN